VSIPWYQAVGNHDAYWIGSFPFDDFADAFTASTLFKFGPF